MQDPAKEKATGKPSELACYFCGGRLIFWSKEPFIYPGPIRDWNEYATCEKCEETHMNCWRPGQQLDNYWLVDDDHTGVLDDIVNLEKYIEREV